MYLSHVKVSYFRNFDYIDIPLTKDINVFYGNNGAGKSSILEFLYYLSLAKSFRSSNHQSLIKSGYDSFSIFAVLIDSDLFYVKDTNFDFEFYYFISIKQERRLCLWSIRKNKLNRLNSLNHESQMILIN